MAEKSGTEMRAGQEGSRWINERPTGPEFAAWYKENVFLDDALDADRYIGGLVLIPAQEKVKVVEGVKSSGEPMIVTRDQLVFVPYPKVDVRIAYFWDLMEAKSEEWHGIVERVPTHHPEPEKTGALDSIQRSLPDGFFILSAPVNTEFTHFLCCATRVSIYEKPIEWIDEEIGEDGKIILPRRPAAAPIRHGEGTKMVPFLAKGYQSTVYADPNLIMKAETGALGRALGMAGIFVVPGAGVATAEDMLEGGAQPPSTAPPSADQAQLPEVKRATSVQTPAEQAETERDQLRSRVKQLLGELEDFPGVREEFTTWCRNTKPPIRSFGDLNDAKLKGVVKRLETLLQGARDSQEARGEASSEEPQAEPVSDPGPAEGEVDPGGDSASPPSGASDAEKGDDD